MSVAKQRGRLRDVGPAFTAEEWQGLVARYDGRCADCGSRKDVTVGHLVPLVHGIKNSNTIEFIVPQCSKCNGRQLTAIHVEAVRRGLVDFDPDVRGISVYIPREQADLPNVGARFGRTVR